MEREEFEEGERDEKITCAEFAHMGTTRARPEQDHEKSPKVFFFRNTLLTLQANRAFMNRKSISILLSEEAENFVKSQPIKAQKKIYFNIFKVEGGVMDKELFKKLEDSEIWELRTLYDGMCYRLFAFWEKDLGAYVMVTHGIVKKTQKTPKTEIEKAERLMHEYNNNKQ